MDSKSEEYLEKYISKFKTSNSDDFRYLERYFRKTIKIENSVIVEPTIKTYTRPIVRVTTESVIDAFRRLVRRRNRVTQEVANAIATAAPSSHASSQASSHEMWRGIITINGTKYKITETTND